MSTYWRKREQEHIAKMIKDDAIIAKKIASNQKQAMNDIQLQIDAFYGRYATTEGITMAEARKRVDKIDIDAYVDKAKRYVKGAHSGDEATKALSFTDRANEEMRLYNATMKINRLELLKANINLELIAMTSSEQRTLSETFTKGARAEYKRQAGILGQALNSNEKNIATIVNSSFLNATWSDRLWANQDALKGEINKLLNRGIVQGKNPRALAKDLRDKFASSVDDSERLMITEMSRVQNDVFMDSAKQLEIDSYEYIAEPSACPICAKLDGEIFKIEDAEIGVNSYPMHPRCRCSQALSMDRGAWESDLDNRGLFGRNEVEKRKDSDILESNRWSDATFSTQKKYDQHIKKHLQEYGDITPEEYVQKARKLLSASLSADVKGFATKDEWVFKYRNSSNDFALGRQDGHIATMFKPVEGKQYWKEQKDKYEPK